MRILLTGGSANGKSTYAEQLARSFPGPHYYMATMRIYDDECKRKVERHRMLRGGSDFITIEKDVNVSDAEIKKDGCVLLECLCNLTANEMFDDAGNMAEPDTLFEKICHDLTCLQEKCTNLIIVTNEVGADGTVYSDSVRAYRMLLGRLNSHLASYADAVFEAVCGILICRKKCSEAKNVNVKMACVLGKVENKMDSSLQLLIIGGEGAGKKEYASQFQFEESDVEMSLHNTVAAIVHEEFAKCRETEKEKVEAEEAAHARIKERTAALVPVLLSKKAVICNEVGSGVIPITKEERVFREETGRLCVLLAKEAGAVVRMICGIPQKIK